MEEYPKPWSSILTRGLTLYQFKKYFINSIGEKEALKSFATLPEGARDTVLDVKKSSWYPFETQRLLRELIISKTDPGNPLEAIFNMGLETASWDFSGFLKPLFSFIPLETILNKTAALWNKYYNTGEITVHSFTKGLARIDLHSFPSDQHFCPVITSWMTMALRTLKKKAPCVNHDICIHKGDSFCRFDLTYTP
ncbi:hypothetical protein GX441_08165 [bacterium]|nr:hypothetical protein [bacterium]